MALSRALYVGQLVSIATQGGANTWYFPVSSAALDITSPIEPVNAFGHLNSLATAQVNLTTCKATIKSYLGTGYSPGNTGGGGVPVVLGITANALQSITGDAVANSMSVITVSPFGFQMSGIVTSIGLDVAVGGFGMCDLVFNGVGLPIAYAPGNAFNDQSGMMSQIEPITTVLVSGSVTGAGCATSFKFSLDMPTDNLVCLGENPNIPQSSAQNSIVSTKPPYKSTITVEGYGVDIDSQNGAAVNALLGVAVSGVYALGHLGVQLPHPHVSNRTFNNAVGAAGATYNYTSEDTAALFVAI
jgi:hypothetical protein